MKDNVVVVLSAIFTLTPCSSIAPFIPTIVPDKDPVIQYIKTDISSILNPTNEGNDDNEQDFEESVANTPKLTIWEFPTERRAFIGDVEIFINSKEDDSDSHEFIDAQNVFILHPHKKHDTRKDFGDEEPFPAFKVKNSSNKNQRTTVKLYPRPINQNVDIELDNALKYASKVNNNKNNVRENREIDFDVNNTSSGTNDRRRRMWNVNDYIQWFLNNNEPSVSDSTIPDSNENQGVEDGSQIKDNDASNEDKISEDAIDLANSKIILQPVSPNLVKFLLEELKDKRDKRNIDSDSATNLLVSDSAEDDVDEVLLDDFLKFLQTGKDLYNVLITVYYFGN